MDLDIKRFLVYDKRKANGWVSTDAGRELTDTELRAFCLWGVANGYDSLKAMPEFEEVEEEVKKYM